MKRLAGMLVAALMACGTPTTTDGGTGGGGSATGGGGSATGGGGSATGGGGSATGGGGTATGGGGSATGGGGSATGGGGSATGGGGSATGGGGGTMDAGQLYDIQILAIADWHAQLDPVSVTGPLADGGSGNVPSAGASALSAYFQRDRQANSRTLTVTAGDDFGGSPPLAAFFAEEPAVRAMNLMGIQANTFGNHNFDRGVMHLQSMINIAAFPYVSTNLDNVPMNLTGVISPFHIIDLGGVKVGIVGITNPDAPTLVAPGRMGTITVPDLAASATRANAARAAALAAGAHVVIALVHMGATLKLNDGGVSGPLIDFAQMLTGFGAIIGDHTDMQVSTFINGQLVVENRSKGVSYSRIAMTVHTGIKTVTNVSNTFVTPYRDRFFGDGGIAADPAIDQMLMPYRSQLGAIFDERLAVTTGVFQRNSSIERTSAAPIGDLVADALRTRYNAQLGLTNGGGLRATIPSPYVPLDAGTLVRTGCSVATPCDVLRGDIYSVLPFGNVVVTRTVTGAQLWNAIEWGLGAMPATSGRFPQISGFQVTWNQAMDAGSRVTSISLPDGGLILRDSTTYTFATNDFTNAGGDGYTMLVDGMGTTREVMADVVADYVRDAGILTPVDGGRIVAQ